jgi:hypothetical protein
MKSYKHDEKDKYAATHDYIEKLVEDARLYYAVWCRYRETLKNPPVDNINALDVARILEDFLHFIIDTRHAGGGFEPFDLMKYYKKQKKEEQD